MASAVTTVDADRVIEAEYEEFKADVLRTVAGKLAATKIRFAGLDMDGFYNQAWYGLYSKLQDGQEIENRKGLLIQMTYRRAIDEYRTLHPDRHADPEVLETVGSEQPIVETLDQQREFKQFVEGMRSSLNQRELQAATLCYVYGLSRPEAAERVGVRPKRMEKIMDEVSRKLRPVLASIKDGNWCEDRATLINQYALGALEPGSEQYEEAVRHLDECPGCRRHVLGARGLAAVTIPAGLALIALTGATAAAAGAGVAGAAGGGTGAGAGAAAGGASMGVAAQAAAVVAAIAAVAVGGAVVATQISGDDEKPAAPAAQKNTDSPASNKPKVKQAAPKKAQKSEPAEQVPTPAPDPESAPQVEQAPQDPPAQPQYTPEHPSDDSGAEFDLQ